MKKLKLLLAALAATVGAGAYAQQVPTDGTAYFLYNVETGTYLTRGNTWGTQAVSYEYGQPWQVYVANGKYTLRMLDVVKAGVTTKGLGGNYTDNGSPIAWALSGNANGYKLQDGANYLTATPGGQAYIIDVAGTNANANTTWQFLTQAEYNAKLAAKTSTQEAAVASAASVEISTTLSDALSTWSVKDMTSRVQNAAATGNGEKQNPTDWTTTGVGNRGGTVNSGTYGCERYQGGGTFSQTVTGLPMGIYKVGIKAMLRGASNAACYAVGQAGYTNSSAFLRANGNTVAIKDWYSSCTAADAPNSTGAFKTIADGGGYYSELYCYVGASGTLSIEAVSEVYWDASWFLFGGVTLEYIWNQESMQSALTAAANGTTAYNGLIPTAAYNAIQAVVTEKNVTYSSVDDYIAAIDAINTAVNTYASAAIQSAYALVLEAKALYNRTDYTDAGDAKATFKGYIDAADEATTPEALNTAIADIKSHVLDFATAVTLDANAYFDLTNFLVVNPTVSENTTGWTISGTKNDKGGSWGVVNFGETEFYQQNFKFYQNLTLPRGTWEFGVTGFHRDGNHSTYFYAGDDKILIPGVASSVVNSMDAAKTYFDNGNGKVALKFALEEASNDLEIGINNTDTETDKWTIFRNFTLKFYGSAIDYTIYQTNWDNALAAANAAKEAHSTVTIGTEYTALNAAIAKTPTGNSKADFTTKTEALTAATTAFTAAAVNYEALAREIVKAKALGIADATADGYAATAESTGATALASTQALMVDEYTYVAENYSHAVELGTWNKSDNAGTMTSQHWDGTSTSVYLEQGKDDLAYNLESWTVTYDQNLTLPAGNYVFKVAGRTATDHVTLTLNVTNVATSAVLGTVNDFPKGDTGLGINKAGATSFDADDAAGFANNGVGRGWQWRYVKFTLAEPATVNVGVVAVADAKYRWMGFCNATVQTDNAANVDLMEALVALNNAKTAATLTQRTNVGAGVFQYEAATDNSLWTAYTTAKSAAEAFELTAESTVESVNALTTDLTTAQAAYTGNTALVAPAAGTRYYIKAAGTAKTGNAVVVSKGATGDNNVTGYNFGAIAAPAEYLAQAFIFTQVSGNTYNISTETAEGTVYLTYGSLNGSAADWKTQQIQGTTDATKKGDFKIVASPTANVFNIINTVHDGGNTAIICQNNDGGSLYTDANGQADFSIAEATQASVTATAKAGKFGTVIFPFVPQVAANENVKFYTVTGVEGERVQLAEAETLAANTPYLIKNTGSTDYSETLTGWGLATADKVDGTLIGVYTAQTIAASVEATAEADGALRYVLQTQGDTQAFYKVSSDFTATAYKCFLTVPVAKTGSGEENAVKAFYLDFGGADAIEGITADSIQNAAIYNLAGQRVNKAQKGLYIIGGKKVVIK